MKNWMKNMKTLNKLNKNTIDLHRYCIANASLSLPMRYLCVALTFLFLVLGGFTMRAWADVKRNYYAGVGVVGGGVAQVKMHWKWGASSGDIGPAKSNEAKPYVEETVTKTFESSIAERQVIYSVFSTTTGYHFDGWFDNSSCSGDASSKNSPWTERDYTKASFNITYYALFSPNTYTIAFNKNGATHGSTASAGATYNQNATLTSNGFYKACYSVDYNANGGTCDVTTDTSYYAFAGWKYNNAGVTYIDGATVRNLTATNDTTLNFYAQWGSVQPVILPTPTKEGYNFAGWYNGDVTVPGNFVGLGGASYTPTEDVELTAKWMEKYDFTVTGDNYIINNEDWNKTDAFTFTFADKAYMTVNIEHDDVISYDVEKNIITALKIGTSKISFTQEEGSSTVKEGDSDEWTITVDSVANTLAVSGTAFTKKVEEEETTVRSGQNSDGTIRTTSSNYNLAHYDIANNKIVVPNSDAQTLPFDDVTITISQDATEKYKYKKHTITLTVQKYDNTLYANGSASYAPTMYVDDSIEDVALTATNTDYTKCPISASQTAGRTIATFEQEDGVVVSYHNLGTATWRMQQDENYKYKAGDNTFSVTVVKEAEATNCYVLANQSNKEKDWHGNTMHEHTWDYEHSAGVATFEISQDALGGDMAFRVQQYLNGSWRDVTSDRTDYNTSWQWRTQTLNRDAKGIRFWVKGSVLSYVRNVSVKRALYLEADDTLRITKTAANNPVYPNDVAGAGMFKISYSIANGGGFKIANDNSSKFTLSKTSFDASDCSAGSETINVTYNPTRGGNDTAHLVVYNRVYRDTVVLIGTCVKHNQTGSWKENIGVLTVGSKVGKPYNATRLSWNGVTYTSSNTSYVEINGDTIIAKAEGTARVYAEVPGDVNYYAIRDSIDIRVTDSLIQYIIWNQDKALRRLKIGDTLALNAYATSDIDTCSTNGSRTITYVSNYPSIAKIVDDNKLVAVSAGTATIVATAAEGKDADKHTYIETELAKTVVVRDPSALCEEKYLFNENDERYVTTDGKKDGVRKDTEISDGVPVPTAEGYVVFEGRSSKSRPTGTLEYAPEYVILNSKNSDGGSGTVYVEQEVGGVWSRVWSKTTFGSSWAVPDTIRSISRNATQIRAGIEQSSNYLYFGGLKVVMASFAEVAETASGAKKDTLLFSSYIGTPQVKDVKVRWYSRRDMQLLLPEGAPFTLSDDAFDKDCDIDTTDLRITFNTMVGQTDSCYNLIFSDGVVGGYRDTVVLKATATTEGVTFEANGDWTDDKWSKTPNEYTVATIAENVALTISTKVEVYSLTVSEGASVTITPTGGLTVGAGGITNASDKKITLQVDDNPESATLGITSYIRISPDYVGEMPEAKIETFSKGYYNKSTGVITWQYMGSPIAGDTMASKVYSTNEYIYTWDESRGKWVNKKSKMKLEPFKGYAVSQSIAATGRKFTYNGQLVSGREPEVITLQYTPGSTAAGCNVLANSYAAPIDISRLDASDFSDGVEATINLFNTGSKDDIDNRKKAGTVNVTAAGQYLSIPVNRARSLYALESYPIVIPPMQGFYINTNKAGTLTLDYERLVWNADYDSHANQALRAPKRAKSVEEDDELSGTLKVTLFTETGLDHMYILESPTNLPEYENGYDAKKMMSGELNIFAVEEEERLAVDATNNIAGTRIGVRTGDEVEYTIAFSKLNSEVGLSLVDRETGVEIAIYEGTEYTFYAAPNETITGRFEIIERFGAPSVTTGTDNAVKSVKAQKFIKDNSLYVLKDGVLYNALGERVR